MASRVCLLGSLAYLTFGFRHVPCPVGTKDAANLIGINSVAVDLFEEGEYELSRGCFAFVYNNTNATAGEIKDASLTNLLAAQERLLAKGVPPEDNLIASWRDLTAEMKRRDMLTIPELDRLTSPFETFLLHGQLECLSGRTASALRAFKHALKHDPQVDFGAAAYAVQGVLARIAIGRGLPRDALKAIEAAERLPLVPSSRQAAMAIALRLQASALLVAAAAELEGGAARVEAASAAAAKVLRKAWGKAEAYRERLLANVGVSAPPASPGAAPPDLFPPVAAVDANSAAPPPRPLPPSEATIDHDGTARIQSSDASALSPVATEFREHGYAVLRGVVPSHVLTALAVRHAILFFGNASGVEGAPVSLPIAQDGLLDAPDVVPDAQQHRRTASDDPLALLVALDLLPLVSAAAGQRVVSTYVFSIAYDDGGVLHPHTDRPQNEISLSLNLATPSLWPLYVAPKGEGEDAAVPVALNVNDALLYRGADHVHFRRASERPLGGRTLQVVFGFRAAHPDHCNSQ